MTLAICIGSYKAPDFLELNIRQCAAIFPDAPILVSDDLSTESQTIQALATRLGCAYTVTDARRGRCGGWLQALVNGMSFAEQEGAEVLLLFGQRFIPLVPKFAATVLDPFKSNRAGVVTFERPAEFMALRADVISADEVLERYRVEMRLGRYHPNASIQAFSEHLIATLKKQHTEPVVEGQYLSHKTAKAEAYIDLAAVCEVQGKFDCRSWAVIEGPQFIGRAETV